MDSLLMTLGFTERKEDSNLYFKVEGGIPVMLLLYVDDMFVIRKEELIKDARRRLDVEFELKDICMMHYFLGMEVWQSANGISLGQGKYAVKILKMFEMMDCKAMATPLASNLKLLSDASSESVDVPDEHETRYFLCYEHIETCSLDDCKAFNEVHEGYS